MTVAARPPAEVPVLIAGGGPVGLATAMELSQHGIRSAVIEPRPEVAWLRPRAKTVSARTMEHFRRWGLADELRDRSPLKVGWSSDIVFCTTLTGREVYRFHDAFGLGLAGSDRVAEPGQQAPQPVVEQLLREVAAADPDIELITGWRVTGAVPDVSSESGSVLVTAEPIGLARRPGARAGHGGGGLRGRLRRAAQCGPGRDRRPVRRQRGRPPQRQRHVPRPGAGGAGTARARGAVLGAEPGPGRADGPPGPGRHLVVHRQRGQPGQR